ncbi:MAG: ABC transporter ATP-binding protein [Candidatus Bathyarchaeia archaeon]
MKKQGKSQPILEIRNLKLNFHTYRGEVKALNGVDLKLYPEEALALVGESGCGKSVTALAITSLLPENAYIVEGEILFRGENLLKKSKEEMREFRMSECAIVFQDPATYLNPVLRMDTQLKEAILLDKEALKKAVIAEERGEKIGYQEFLAMKTSQDELSTKGYRVSQRKINEMAEKLIMDILNLVKLPDPERILASSPPELSGGMKQRTMIAMALARRPSIFLADEITTALDVTIQAQILYLLKELRQKIATSILLITHDLSVAAEIADRIAVMYGGNVVEVASTRAIFKKPLHPYTQLLLKAIPNILNPAERLESIPGTVPEMINPPPGCRFNPRCPYAMDLCRQERPKLKEVEKEHEVACYLYRK